MPISFFNLFQKVISGTYSWVVGTGGIRPKTYRKRHAYIIFQLIFRATLPLRKAGHRIQARFPNLLLGHPRPAKSPATLFLKARAARTASSRSPKHPPWYPTPWYLNLTSHLPVASIRLTPRIPLLESLRAPFRFVPFRESSTKGIVPAVPVDMVYDMRIRISAGGYCVGYTVDHVQAFEDTHHLVSGVPESPRPLSRETRHERSMSTRGSEVPDWPVRSPNQRTLPLVV